MFSRTQSKWLILVGIFAGMFITILIFVIISLFRPNKYQSEWFSSISADGQNKIRVTLDGEVFTFGPQRIGVYANDIFLFSTEIFNDGKGLRDKNYVVEWFEDYAFLTFIGEEQSDECFKIIYKVEGITYSRQ